MARSNARKAAMQLLYEKMTGGDAGQESLEMVYEQLSGEKPEGSSAVQPSDDDRTYICDILSGVEEHQQELDATIEAHSTGNWTLQRVPHVDLSILRLAAYELLHRSDVPDSVAISEALHLSNVYSEPKSTRYINGVLGALEREKNEDK
ncbi:MAG: transcription antitermination factor NusB [Clostridia bacterium]|nr:transcription antitermination factor NusB [Clostridia bacterium]